MRYGSDQPLFIPARHRSMRLPGWAPGHPRSVTRCGIRRTRSAWWTSTSWRPRTGVPGVRTAMPSPRSLARAPRPCRRAWASASQGALEEPQVPLALLGQLSLQIRDPAFQVRPARRSNAGGGRPPRSRRRPWGRSGPRARACRTVLLVAADPAVHQGLLDAGRADHALAPFRQFADRHHHDVSHDAHPSIKKCRYYIDTCRSDDNIDIVSILSHGYKLMQYRYYIDSIAQPSTYRYSIDIFLGEGRSTTQNFQDPPGFHWKSAVHGRSGLPAKCPIHLTRNRAYLRVPTPQSMQGATSCNPIPPLAATA